MARRTLGVGMAMDETTFMRRMPTTGASARRPDLVGLPWAGPSDGATGCLNFCNPNPDGMCTLQTDGAWRRLLSGTTGGLQDGPLLPRRS